LLLQLFTRAGFADEDPARVAEARQRFVVGTELVKKAQWSEALAAFEESVRLRPHPITQYNIGACERALGRYSRAREAFARALAPSEKPQDQLPTSLVEEARGFVAEIDGLLAHLDLAVDPPEASVALDGHPLSAPPTAPGRWSLVLDPGAHIFTLARRGYADVVVNRSLAPGSHAPLALQLDRLPATLHLSCDRPQAVVTVDGIDVGAAPVDLQRPAGTHAITMARPGFVTYHGKLTVQPGEEARLNAPLEEQRTPIYRKWWFWTAAVVVVAGAVVGSFFAARAAETPTVDGGGLGWSVKLR
jgi:hypothetical protein